MDMIGRTPHNALDFILSVSLRPLMEASASDAVQLEHPQLASVVGEASCGVRIPSARPRIVLNVFLRLQVLSGETRTPLEATPDIV